MTKTQMEFYRPQLLELQRHLQDDVGIMIGELLLQTEEASGNLSNVPVENRAERGASTYDEEVTIGLLENEEPRLGEINAALERIDKVIFGQCEECSIEISRERLEAVPFARRCIACARTAQQRTNGLTGQPVSV